MELTHETRSVDAAEFRAEERDNSPVIEGFFAVYDEVYEIYDGVSERIDPHAFDDTLKSDDIRALVNHDSTKVIGRRTAGTLELEARNDGLWGRVHINPDDPDGRSIWQKVKRGDVSQCSIGFDILKEEMQKLENGARIFLLKQIRLWEVSVCTFPAYTSTQVEARSRRIEDVKKRLFDAWKDEMQAKFRSYRK